MQQLHQPTQGKSKAGLSVRFSSLENLKAWSCHKSLVYGTQPNHLLGTCRSGCNHDGDGSKMSSPYSHTAQELLIRRGGQLPPEQCLVCGVHHLVMYFYHDKYQLVCLECSFVHWLQAIIISRTTFYLITIYLHRSRSMRLFIERDSVRQGTEWTHNKGLP